MTKGEEQSTWSMGIAKIERARHVGSHGGMAERKSSRPLLRRDLMPSHQGVALRSPITMVGLPVSAVQSATALS